MSDFRNFHKLLSCVPIKIFWGKFSKICPASPTKKFCLEISQIFWKNWWAQSFQMFVKKFIRTYNFLYWTKPWFDFWRAIDGWLPRYHLWWADSEHWFGAIFSKKLRFVFCQTLEKLTRTLLFKVCGWLLNI